MWRWALISESTSKERKGQSWHVAGEWCGRLFSCSIFYSSDTVLLYHFSWFFLFLSLNAKLKEQKLVTEVISSWALLKCAAFSSSAPLSNVWGRIPAKVTRTGVWGRRCSIRHSSAVAEHENVLKACRKLLFSKETLQTIFSSSAITQVTRGWMIYT